MHCAGVRHASRRHKSLCSRIVNLRRKRDRFLFRQRVSTYASGDKDIAIGKQRRSLGDAGNCHVPRLTERASGWIVKFCLIRFRNTVGTASPTTAKPGWVATGDENLSVY